MIPNATAHYSLGERVPKYGMTHNQSFPGPSGSSVNQRTIDENFPPLVYGFCLRGSSKTSSIHVPHMSASTAEESLTCIMTLF